MFDLQLKNCPVLIAKIFGKDNFNFLYFFDNENSY